MITHSWTSESHKKDTCCTFFLEWKKLIYLLQHKMLFDTLSDRIRPEIVSWDDKELMIWFFWIPKCFFLTNGYCSFTKGCANFKMEGFRTASIFIWTRPYKCQERGMRVRKVPNFKRLHLWKTPKAPFTN